MLINNQNAAIRNKQYQIANKQREIDDTTAYVAELKSLNQTTVNNTVNTLQTALNESQAKIDRYDAALNTYIGKFLATYQNRTSLLTELKNTYNFSEIDLEDDTKYYAIVNSKPSNGGNGPIYVIQNINSRVNTNNNKITSDNNTITSQKNSIPKKTPDINTREECQAAIDNFEALIEQNTQSFLTAKQQLDNDPDNSELELEVIGYAEAILLNQNKKAEYEGYLEQYSEKYDTIEEKQAEIDRLTQENAELNSIKEQLLSNEPDYITSIKEVL